jgi:hypothetical protein
LMKLARSPAGAYSITMHSLLPAGNTAVGIVMSQTHRCL